MMTLVYYVLNRACNELIQRSDQQCTDKVKVLVSSMNHCYIEPRWDGIGEWQM